MSKQKSLSPRQAAACRKPIDGLLDARWFKAMGDPTRLAILGCLAKCGRACSVTEMAACCSVDFSVVSRHLALLGRAGIVQSSRRGRTVSSGVNYGELAGKLRALAGAFESCCAAPPGRSARRGRSGQEACCG